jgi:hypothetical protein
MGIRRLISKLRDAVHRVIRPSAVTYAQRAHVKKFPSCAGCGSQKHLQGHHIKPYNKFPNLAANPLNFITLCMDTNECHIRIGHGDSFRCYNPHVVADAADALSGTVPRAAVNARAKAARLADA